MHFACWRQNSLQNLQDVKTAAVKVWQSITRKGDQHLVMLMLQTSFSHSPQGICNKTLKWTIQFRVIFIVQNFLFQIYCGGVQIENNQQCQHHNVCAKAKLTTAFYIIKDTSHSVINNHNNSMTGNSMDVYRELERVPFKQLVILQQKTCSAWDNCKTTSTYWSSRFSLYQSLNDEFLIYVGMQTGLVQ